MRSLTTMKRGQSNTRCSAVLYIAAQLQQTHIPGAPHGRVGKQREEEAVYFLERVSSTRNSTALWRDEDGDFLTDKPKVIER